MTHLRQAWAVPSKPRPIVIIGAGGVVRTAHPAAETAKVNLLDGGYPEVLARPSESVRAWLNTVAKNLVIDDRRSARFTREQQTEEMLEPYVGITPQSRFDVAAAREELDIIWRREMLRDAYVPRWVAVRTPIATLRAPIMVLNCRVMS